MAAKWFSRRRSKDLDGLATVAVRGIEAGYINLRRQLDVHLPEASVALRAVDSADSPDAVRAALEEWFSLEEAFLAELAEDDRRQAAFTYNGVVFDPAYSSAYQIITQHSHLTIDQLKDYASGDSSLDRNIALTRSRHPDHKQDAWAVGLEEHRIEIDTFVETLESYL